MSGRALRPLVLLVVHVGAGVAAFLTCTYLAGTSPYKIVYGFISGWVCALLIDLVAKTRLSSALWGIFIFAFVGILAFLLRWEWFHDLPTDFSLTYVSWLLLWGAVFVSPILISIPLRHLIARFGMSHSPD